MKVDEATEDVLLHQRKFQDTVKVTLSEIMTLAIVIRDCEMRRGTAWCKRAELENSVRLTQEFTRNLAAEAFAYQRAISKLGELEHVDTKFSISEELKNPVF